MAQLFYRYGTMNSGKSIELLKVAHNYEEQGKRVIIMTSAIYTRSGFGKVESRIGVSKPAIAITSEMDVYGELVEIIDQYEKVDCILVDESQFLSRENIIDLSLIVMNEEVPVICYGLRNDFQNNLFKGSEALLTFADKIEEIKTICHFCNKKAVMNARIVDGIPVYSGEQIVVGGNEDYLSVCRNHYYNED